MKKQLLAISLTLLGLSFSPTRAGLLPGAKLPPYEVHNVATDGEYSALEAFRGKRAIVAYHGSITDAGFWADCRKLQTLQAAFPDVGVFAQLTDGGNATLLAAQARENGVTIPIVYAVGDEWKERYRVKEAKSMNRVIYLSKDFRLEWSAVGLTEETLAELTRRLKSVAPGSR